MNQLLHGGPVRLKKTSRGGINGAVSNQATPPPDLIAIAVGLIFPLSPRRKSLFRQTSMRSAAQQLASHQPHNSVLVEEMATS